MNYQQTLDYLFAMLPMYQRQGKIAFKKDLTNIIKLCDKLQNPQNSFKSIHIAGTNGKGSTSHILASILQSKGYKVGLYTSPHLKSFTERIKINGKVVEEQFVIDFVKDIQTEIEEIAPSFFEITVAMAFAYFQKENVDYAVIETGLGGRLDSTNILNPIACLITNISFDHESMLGNSLKEIANEKAGIIKEKTPIIISERQSEVEEVFIDKSTNENAPLFFADDSFFPAENRGDKIVVKENDELYLTYTPALLGDHQVRNVIGILKLLEVLNFDIPTNTIIEGIEGVVINTGLKGRWQILDDKPYIICDVGHNKEGIKLIVSQINRVNFDSLHIVLGMVNDKNISEILSLLPKYASYYFCKPNVPRGLDVEVLKKEAEKCGLIGVVCNSVNGAITKAKSKAQINDLIFIGGSTFVVAEIENL